MKRLASLVMIAGLFATTGCIKCKSCDCPVTQTTKVTTVVTDGIGGIDTDINSGVSTGSTSISSVCNGDQVWLSAGHMVDAGNVDGTHTYVNTEVDVSDNFFDNGTTTATSETTTTYECSCEKS